MDRYRNNVGVLVPNIMLPPRGTDFEKWAVVGVRPVHLAARILGEGARADRGRAHHARPHPAGGRTWARATRRSASTPSARTWPATCATACSKNTTRALRWCAAPRPGARASVWSMALDLEQYDYHKGATTLIRATEGTIESRIPPRLRIREGAKLELPHIIVLIDDPGPHGHRAARRARGRDGAALRHRPHARRAGTSRAASSPTRA